VKLSSAHWVARHVVLGVALAGGFFACAVDDADWGAPRRDDPHIVFQRQEHDCGIAALATLFVLLKEKPGYDDLAMGLDAGRDGLSMYALTEAALAHGVELQGYRFRDLMMAEDAVAGGPWIALLGSGRNGHYVVVQETVGDTTFVLDPVIGSRLIKRNRFEAMWTGYALIVQ